MNRTIKRIVYPFRKLAARFVEIDPPIAESKIIYKAANIVASEKIEGDYLEFGVFAGHSFIDSYNVIKEVFEYHSKTHSGRREEGLSCIKAIWENMRFFAFDSFQGLPELAGVDKQTSYFNKGEYKSADSQFRENLIKAGIPLDKVIMVDGWFEDTCNQETIRRFRMRGASIIHIDCDLFSSTRVALDFIRPLMLDGTVIIFDDWYCYRGNPRLGEAGAFNEWKERMPGWTFVEYQKEGSSRNSFIASKGE
jgi:O-methyltransferase